MRPRLVATDLDGTLLDPSGRVTPYTREVLTGLWERGVETLFVTARPPRWLDDLADAVGGHGVAICANGAFLYDVHARRVVESHLLPLTDVLALADDLRAAIPGVGFALEHADGMYAEPAYGPPDPVRAGPAARVGDLAGAGVEGVGKMLARVPGGEGVEGAVGPETDPAAVAAGARFADDVARVVAGRGEVHFSGACGLAEIAPRGMSKAVALARWCERRGVDAAQVWAFGDMPNDIPMLRWAGRSFAVAGSPPEVRAAATDVCGGNDADGVAHALAPLLG